MLTFDGKSASFSIDRSPRFLCGIGDFRYLTFGTVTACDPSLLLLPHR